MMTLLVFLDFLNKNKSLPCKLVLCFFGKEYPLIFFSYLFSFLQKYNHRVERVDIAGVDFSLIKAHISTMSFNGQMIYWLHGIHTLTAKKQQEWLLYVQLYTGPHILLFFSTEESYLEQMHKSESIQHIVVPNEIQSHDFSKIRFLVNDTNVREKTQFSSRIASHTQQISLDNACLFAHYEIVVGKNVDDFFKKWVAQIIEPTHSFFLLSQHFFSKKAQLFFEHWSYSAESYMPPFWATFWADQVWRAYIYCDLMKQKKYVEAKKAQYKLPFSFINRDWSSLSLAELQHAHQFLSNMDFRLKNGGSPVALELFYGMFFSNKFR